MSFSVSDYHFELDANGLNVFTAGAGYLIPYMTLAVLAFILIVLLSAATLVVSRFRSRPEKFD